MRSETTDRPGENTMRTVAIDGYGGRDRLAVTELPVPRPGNGEVLVRVAGAGVNPVDVKIREGQVRIGQGKFPLVLGWDVSGTVAEVGPGVPSFSPGDEVYGLTEGTGAYAEYAVAPAANLALKPRSIDPVHAAALPLVGLTAWQAIVEKLQVAEGETVLVIGASGGVGSFAVQLAADRGARAIGAASARNSDFLKELGAAETVDYRERDVAEAVRAAHPDGVDAMLDAHPAPDGGSGDETTLQAAGAVRSGGRIATLTAADETLGILRERGFEARRVAVRSNADALAELSGMVDEGSLSVPVAEVLPLEEAARAHELSEGGRVRGKLVLSVA